MGCAIIVAARRSLGVKPWWNPEFDVIFKKSFDSISPAFERVFLLYSSTFPEKKTTSRRSESVKKKAAHVQPDHRRQTIDHSSTSTLVPAV